MDFVKESEKRFDEKFGRFGKDERFREHKEFLHSEVVQAYASGLKEARNI